MMRARHAIVVAIAVLWLGGAPMPALGSAEAPDPLVEVTAPPHAGHYIYDLVVLRPFRIVHLAVGAVALIPAYPLSWLIGADDAVVEACIVDPADRAFAPLGTL